MIEVTVGPVAHGGHAVARHEGRVIFVRHGIPGERVRIELTESGGNAKFWRADVTEVLEASPERVAHPWPLADALLARRRGTLPVGGAEFGHISLAHQRGLKAAVFEEQLRRLADLDRGVTVEAVPDEQPDGLGWRTRASFSVDPAGRLSMHAHRSEILVPVQEMPLAVPAINALRLWDIDFTSVARVEVAAPANGSQPLVLLIPGPTPDPRRLGRIAGRIDGASVAVWTPDTGTLERLRGRTWVAETAAGHDYRVTGEGFWQIHRAAPDVLATAVLEALQPQPGERIADLYAGAGLFSAPLAAAVGPAGAVLSVEGAAGTSRDARKNMHAYPQVAIRQGKVERVLAAYDAGLDAVVLDPPRAGAGRAVVQQLAAARLRAVAYVSCDPASFARDAGYFAAAGWRIETLRVFDLYPHTHHMEAVALLVPAG